MLSPNKELVVLLAPVDEKAALQPHVCTHVSRLFGSGSDYLGCPHVLRFGTPCRAVAKYDLVSFP